MLRAKVFYLSSHLISSAFTNNVAAIRCSRTVFTSLWSDHFVGIDEYWNDRRPLDNGQTDRWKIVERCGTPDDAGLLELRFPPLFPQQEQVNKRTFLRSVAWLILSKIIATVAT